MSLDRLREAADGDGDPTGLAALLLPLDAGLEDLPSLILDAADLPRVARGQAVRAPGGEPGESPVRLFDGAGRLVAIGRWRGGTLLPDKVLVDAASTGELPGRPAFEAHDEGAKA